MVIYSVLSTQKYCKHSFATERSVQSLSEGYTKVEAKHIMYEKIPGEKQIRIDFQQRNIAEEAAAQLTRQLNFPESLIRQEFIQWM